jgi:hypothetical protein
VINDFYVTWVKLPRSVLQSIPVQSHNRMSNAIACSELLHHWSALAAGNFAHLRRFHMTGTRSSILLKLPNGRGGP